MPTALNVDRIVRVSVNLQPKAAPRRGFGLMCVLSAEEVISPGERLRYYGDLDSIAKEFGLSSPVYLAAELYFAQSPKPVTLAVGRWIRASSPAVLAGGVPDAGDAQASSWEDITDGSFGFTLGGAGVSVTDLDFTGVTNMNGVAAIISAALGVHGASCAWEGERFVILGGCGPAGSLGYGAPVGEGADISYKLGITQGRAEPPLPGFEAESAAECAAALADLSADWYGLAFAEPLTNGEHLAVAAFIEGTGKSRVYFATVTDARVLSPQAADDLPSLLKALARKRTFVQYSKNPNAALSAAGRAFTVNFNANRSVITLKFKQEPGVVAEGLTETQARALEGKNCNVFAYYDNDTAILQEGVVASGAYFDEIHGLDWLQNALQTECYNLLYQSKSKLPQTDGGVAQIITTISRVLEEAVNNGLVAPGVWNADGFGLLERGDYLPAGYYVYARSVDDQPQSEREQRKAPALQIAAKLSGAIHSLDVIVDVNR